MQAGALRCGHGRLVVQPPHHHHAPQLVSSQLTAQGPATTSVRRTLNIQVHAATPLADQQARLLDQPVPPVDVASLEPPFTLASRNGLYDAQGRLLLKNLTLPELEEFCISIGELPRRARQLYKALYGNGRWVRNLDELDRDSVIAFSAAFKNKIASSASLSGGLTLTSVHTARDGTHKLVFALNSDEGGVSGTVETVLIPMTNRQGGNLRYTACLSTQVGCAMNCQFCYTGRMGLLGNLSTAQVVEQVVQARRWLAEQASLASQTSAAHSQGQEAAEAVEVAQDEEQVDEPLGALSLLASHQMPDGSTATAHTAGTRGLAAWLGKPNRQGVVRPVPISNIVFMGMGEPLHNYDTVMSSIDILAEGLELSRSKIIVSTVGLADRMRQFLALNKAKLALSLHATTDAVRDWIVPQNRRFNIAELMSVLRQYFPAGQKGDKFVVLEYCLLAGVNDSVEDAHRLVELTQDIYCMVNLIVFNPHEGTPFKRSQDEAVRAFRGVLMDAGRVCTLRVSKGDDEMAACGQLGDPGQSIKPVPVAAPPAALKDLLAGAAAFQAAAKAEP